MTDIHNILYYNQGLSPYCIGKQEFWMDSYIHEYKPTEKNEGQEGAEEPYLNPKTKKFQPFELLFLKSAKNILSKSLEPGGRFVIYLKDSVKQLIPMKTGFRAYDWRPVYWKGKNTIGTMSNDGFIKIDPTREGELHLYIRINGQGPVICFQEDKPDDEDIAHDVLIATVVKAPAGKDAMNWNFQEHIQQHFIGTYNVVCDAATNTLGSFDWGTPARKDNVPGHLRLGNTLVIYSNHYEDNAGERPVASLRNDNITCYKIDREGIEVIYCNSIEELQRKQLELSGKAYVIPLFQADGDGNVVMDFRAMPRM